MSKDEVITAFKLLLEEMGMVIDKLKEKGAVALQKSAYDKAREYIEKANALEKIKDKARQLQNEWQKAFSLISVRSTKKRKRKVKSRLERGLRTPEDAFRIPILKALLKLNGSAPMATVLEFVEEQMEEILNDYDRQLLPSKKMVRWKNTAQWCKYKMVQEGLLDSNSSRGIWTGRIKNSMDKGDRQKI